MILTRQQENVNGEALSSLPSEITLIIFSNLTTLQNYISSAKLESLTTLENKLDPPGEKSQLNYQV